MRQPVRFFSLGIVVTSLIVLVFYFFDDTKAKSNDMSVDEMISAIESDGYRVVTEDQYITLSVDDKKGNETTNKSEQKEEKTNTEKTKDTSTKDDENKPAKEDTEKTFTLKIESGMASSTISTVLAENNIIKDADTFTKYLEDEGYSTKIQLGEFKVSSSMSHYEIAEVLTN